MATDYENTLAIAKNEKIKLNRNRKMISQVANPSKKFIYF